MKTQQSKDVILFLRETTLQLNGCQYDLSLFNMQE